MGLQTRPDITEKGFGTEFVKSVIDFGRQKCKYNYIDLTVAKFNKRAIKVYEKIGFQFEVKYIQKTNGGEFEFIKMKKVI